MAEKPPPPKFKLEKTKAAPKKKPSAAPKKVPVKPREGAVGVRDSRDKTFDELDYLERRMTGEVKLEEVLKRQERRIETRRKNGIPGLDEDVVGKAHEEIQSALRQGIDVTQIDASLARRLAVIEDTRQFEFYVVMTGRVVPLGDSTRFQKEIDTLTALIPENFGRMKPQERAEHAVRIASVLQKQYRVSHTAREVEDHILEYLFSMGSVDAMEQLLKSREFRQAFAVSKASSSSQAFREAVSYASPEAQKLYEEYLHIWEGDSFKDFWGTAEGAAEGALANFVPAGEAVQAAAKTSLEADGIIFSSASGNSGQLRLGSFEREAEIYEVEGAPKIVISGGDRKDIGPLDTSEVRQAMENLVLDQYFSQKFMEFAPRDASEGPRAVDMGKIALVLRAFLPHASQKIEGTLEAEQRIVIVSLAYMMAAPGKPPYRTLQEKAQFLSEISKDASRLDSAKRLLAPESERDIFAKFTLNEFAGKLA